MNVSEILKHFDSIGIDHRKHRPDKVDKAPQYFGFQFQKYAADYRIEVECTSRVLLEEFAKCFTSEKEAYKQAELTDLAKMLD